MRGQHQRTKRMSLSRIFARNPRDQARARHQRGAAAERHGGEPHPCRRAPRSGSRVPSATAFSSAATPSSNKFRSPLVGRRRQQAPAARVERTNAGKKSVRSTAAGRRGFADETPGRKTSDRSRSRTRYSCSDCELTTEGDRASSLGRQRLLARGRVQQRLVVLIK